MKILVTGFEPFGGERLNPSLLAANALPDTIAGAQICKLTLPVAFSAAEKAVREAVGTLRPDAALLIGLAGGRSKISLERVAINVCDARIPDNDGYTPTDVPIREGGPAAYFSTLPIRRMAKRIEAGGIPAEISNSAGTYVCNHCMYCALDEIALLGLNARAGFIHVPYLPEQGEAHGVAGLELTQTVRALVLAIEEIARCSGR